MSFIIPGVFIFPVCQFSVNKATQAISGGPGELHSSSSSSQNDYEEPPPIHTKDDPKAKLKFDDDLDSPTADMIRHGCTYRIYGESGSWHIPGGQRKL